jgi:hypothetical protein
MATKSWLDEIEWLEYEEEKSTSLPKPASWLNEIDWEDKEDKVAELETLSQKPSWLNGVEWLEEEPTKPVARRPLVSPRAPTLESMGVTAMEETMPEESFLRPLADPLLNIGAGINDVVKGFTDAFGADNAVSQNLAKNSEWYRSLLSAGAKQDQEEIGRIMQEAEGQGVLAEIGAGLKALTVAPSGSGCPRYRVSDSLHCHSGCGQGSWTEQGWYCRPARGAGRGGWWRYCQRRNLRCGQRPTNQ